MKTAVRGTENNVKMDMDTGEISLNFFPDPLFQTNGHTRASVDHKRSDHPKQLALHTKEI